jgi:ABC-type nitrate/sulfonate/bicarbonate transport system permease component
MTHPRTRRFGRAWSLAAPYLVPLALLAIWEATVRAGWIEPFLLPAPSSIARRWAEEAAAGDILRDGGLTIARALSGFFIAATLGIAIGTLAARNGGARWFVDPVVSVGFPMPKISFMPIFMLWFGLGDSAKLAMIVFTCIFPVISATYLGTSSIDRYLIWSARNLGTSPRRMLWKVVIPAALPQILSGLQIAFPMALIVTVVTEMITSGGGLGSYMIVAARAALSEKVFAGIATIAVLGYLLLKVFDGLRRRLLRWHAETLVTI